ncbi:acyl-CoA thioesterase [Rhodococcus sp. 5G237]
MVGLGHPVPGSVDDSRRRTERSRCAAGVDPPVEPLPEDAILRTCMIAYLSDLGLLSTSLAPHGFTCWAPGVPRASLDHTIWFHSPALSAEWILFDQSSEWAGGARGLSTGRVFDATGRLVASLAQEGLIRPS